MDSELKVLRKLIKDDVSLVLAMRELKRIERLILIETYCKGLRQDATVNLAKELCYSESSIKRIRKIALEKLYISIGGVLQDGS